MRRWRVVVVMGDGDGSLDVSGDGEGKRIWMRTGRRYCTATTRAAKGLEVDWLLVENTRIARCRKWSVAQFRGSASDDSARGLCRAGVYKVNPI